MASYIEPPRYDVEPNLISSDELDGVKMVQFLQKYVGVDEPFRDALAGWQRMTEDEKKTTQQVYDLLSIRERK